MAELHLAPGPFLAVETYSWAVLAGPLKSWVASAFLAAAVEVGATLPGPMLAAAEFLLVPSLDLCGHLVLWPSEEGLHP